MDRTSRQPTSTRTRNLLAKRLPRPHHRLRASTPLTMIIGLRAAWCSPVMLRGCEDQAIRQSYRPTTTQPPPFVERGRASKTSSPPPPGGLVVGFRPGRCSPRSCLTRVPLPLAARTGRRRLAQPLLGSLGMPVRTWSIPVALQGRAGRSPRCGRRRRAFACHRDPRIRASAGDSFWNICTRGSMQDTRSSCASRIVSRSRAERRQERDDDLSRYRYVTASAMTGDRPRRKSRSQPSFAWSTWSWWSRR